MKELKSKVKEKTEQSVKKQQEEESKLNHVKTIFPHSNHKLFEININTLEVKEAEYNLKKDYIFDPKWKPGKPIQSEKSLIINPDCDYVSALSKERALHKWQKGEDGSKFREKGTIKFY